MNVDKVIAILEDWERLPLAIVTMAGPWLTPLVPAYFVAVSIHNYLKAPAIIAVCAGIVLEVVGIAGIANATRAYIWNKSKRKSDKEAPLALSLVAVSVYFFTALLLTVVLEVWADLAPFAPGMFIILSVSSGLILVLSSIQRRVEKSVKIEKVENRQNRTEKRTKVRIETDKSPANGQSDWVSVQPENLRHFKQLVENKTLVLPAGLTGPNLASKFEVVKGERTGLRWLDAVGYKNRNGQD